MANKTIGELNPLVTNKNSSFAIFNGLNPETGEITNGATGRSTIQQILNTAIDIDENEISIIEAVGNLSSTVSNLNNTVGNLASTVSGLNTTINSLSSTVTSLNTTVTNLASTVTNLNTSVSNLASTVGNQDISSIGDGTATGAIKSIKTLIDSTGTSGSGTVSNQYCSASYNYHVYLKTCIVNITMTPNQNINQSTGTLSLTNIPSINISSNEKLVFTTLDNDTPQTICGPVEIDNQKQCYFDGPRTANHSYKATLIYITT